VTLANTLKLTATPVATDILVVVPAVALIGNPGSMFAAPNTDTDPDIVTDMPIFMLYK
jgi:hypothetical protein